MSAPRTGGLVDVVDTTLRDGNQSLWSATGLTTYDIVAIAPTIDRVGFRAVDFTSSTHMAVAVRFHREDPWERLRLVRAAMPETRLGFITTGMRFITWVPVDEDVMRLAFRCVVRNGIRRFQFADPSNDPVRLRRVAALAHEEGVEEVIIGLTYSISEVHTHAYYAERAAALADCADMDGLYLKDPGGLLTQAAVRSWRRISSRPPVSVRSSCTATARSASRRSSTWRGCVPGSTRSTPPSRRWPAGRPTRPPRRRFATWRRRASAPPGRRRSRRDVGVLPGLAREKGLPVGRPQEFDSTYYHHQLAGGMVSTTQRMLDELRRPELFPRVLEEVGRVRAEMGYPIIVTPVSQLVATQAVRNVLDGERWSNVSDETVRYFLGHYGDPAAPVDPDVADRVLSRPRAAELSGLEPLQLEGAEPASGQGSRTRSCSCA